MFYLTQTFVFDAINREIHLTAAKNKKITLINIQHSIVFHYCIASIYYLKILFERIKLKRFLYLYKIKHKAKKIQADQMLQVKLNKATKN